MVTKEMTKAWAERERVTQEGQSKSSAAAAWSGEEPRRGRAVLENRAGATSHRAGATSRWRMPLCPTRAYRGLQSDASTEAPLHQVPRSMQAPQA